MSAFENPKALGQIMQQHAQDALFWRALNDVARANRLRDRLAAMDLAAAPPATRGGLEQRRMALLADLDARLACEPRQTFDNADDPA